MEYAAPLHFAATSGKPDAEAFIMMEHLLELGVDINGMDEVQGPYGRGTPLHYAAISGRVERVRFLLEHGADPHMTHFGWKPIDEARKYWKSDVVKFLKDRERSRL